MFHFLYDSSLFFNNAFQSYLNIFLFEPSNGSAAAVVGRVNAWLEQAINSATWVP